MNPLAIWRPPRLNFPRVWVAFSSGLKLKIDEDAGGLAVSSKLDSTISRSAAIAKNLQNGLSFLESQDASESRLGAIITRMSELRHRYDDLTLNLGDRHGLNREFKELKEEIKSIAQRKFNGISLFSNQSDTQSKLIVNTTSGTQPTLAQISRNLFFNSILDTNATAGPIGANLTVQGSRGSFAGTTVTPTGGNTPNQTVNGAAGSTPAETFKGVQGSTPSQTVAGGIPAHSRPNHPGSTRHDRKPNGQRRSCRHDHRPNRQRCRRQRSEPNHHFFASKQPRGHWIRLQSDRSRADGYRRGSEPRLARRDCHHQARW